MSLLTYTVLWGVLTLIVIVLAVYRMRLVGHTDELIHIEDAATELISQQVEVAKKVDVIDKWGKALTVLAVVAGLAIVAAYTYQVWVKTSTAPW